MGRASAVGELAARQAIPPFAYSFSGAPVIWPPLGALAVHAGGLAGARVLSLVFMLARRYCCGARPGTATGGGRRSSPWHCSPAGPDLHLGVFATIRRCRCFWWRWRPGWCCGPGTGARCRAASSRRARRWPWPAPRPIDGSVRCAGDGAGGAGRVSAPDGRVAPRRVAVLAADGDRVPGAGCWPAGKYLNGFKVTVLSPVAHASSRCPCCPAPGTGRALPSSWPWPRPDQRGAAEGPGPDLAAGRPGRRRDPGPGRAGPGCTRWRC